MNSAFNSQSDVYALRSVEKGMMFVGIGRGAFRNWLGRHLCLANSVPGAISQGRFYDFKKRMIDAFSHRVGTDLQHIQKTCWACDGTGVFTGYDNGCTWVKRSPEPCCRCRNGVYEEFWIRLARYKIGNNIFHTPLERIWHRRLLPPETSIGAKIEGLITHRNANQALAANSFLVLALVFDLGLFFSLLGNFRMPTGRKFFPLVWLSNGVYQIRWTFQKMERRTADFFRMIRRSAAGIFGFNRKRKAELEFDDLPF